MITAGVDLAAEATGTAIAVIGWSGSGAQVTTVLEGAHDADVLAVAQEADKVGVDCPFGWPIEFVRAVHDHERGQLMMPESSGREWRRGLTMRATDQHVQRTTGLTPLSVAADRIGHAALRWAALAARPTRVDSCAGGLDPRSDRPTGGTRAIPLMAGPASICVSRPTSARPYASSVIAWTPFAAGLGAGLGIALPLGAIGVLIVREGVERGIRAAAVAALAVATVDFGYALVAVVVGERIAEALSGVERVVQLVGALALTAVVIIGVRGLLRSVRAAPGATEQSVLPELPVGYGRTFLRFVGLTAINPMTAVYFVALTAGLAQRLSGPGAGGAFAVGVFLGSLAWQMVLAVGGGTAGSRMSERVRIGVSLAGYAIVAGYAVKLALGG